MTDAAGMDLSPLAMVVFDWAGTMVDFGCKAPVLALAKAFALEGLSIAESDLRADMGLAKMDHMRALLARPVVAEAWRAHKGQPADEGDVARIYKNLEGLITEAAAEASQLIAGAGTLVRTLRGYGLKIASTTGYTRSMMEAVLSRAAVQGYQPDLVTCAGDTLQGRPSPLMMYRSALELGVWPMRHVVKIDDAASGIGEGLAAGAWTVGLAASGNGVGLSEVELAALSASERQARIAHSRHVLEEAGAHYVVDTVADCLPILAHIAARLRAKAYP
jgi:phosphonoacetaldehyde hydrolase